MRHLANGLAFAGRHGPALVFSGVLIGLALPLLALPLVPTPAPAETSAAPVIHPAPSLHALVHAEPGPPDALDPLRIDALQGNLDASAELAQRLIDRFEQTREQEDLYEAFQWIARDWDQREFLRTDIIQRAVTHHCGGPVLRWHWLCVAGE